MDGVRIMPTRLPRRQFLGKAVGTLSTVSVLGLGTVESASAANWNYLTITEQSGSGRIDYIVDTVGDIDKRGSADSADEDLGTKADGYVLDGGEDAWQYKGEVISLQVHGSGTVEFDFSNQYTPSRRQIEVVGTQADTQSYYDIHVAGNIYDADDMEGNDSYSSNYATGYVINGKDTYHVADGDTNTRFLNIFINPSSSGYVTINRLS